MDMTDKVKEVVEEFVNNNEAFTALQVSNKLKEKGEDVRHTEIATIVRAVYESNSDGVFDIYIKTDILVDVEEADIFGNKQSFKRTANLYHSPLFNVDDYKSTNLKALSPVHHTGTPPPQTVMTPVTPPPVVSIQPVKSTRKEDIVVTALDVDFSSYETDIQAKGIVEISGHSLSEKFLFGKEFNISLYPERIILFSSNHGIRKQNNRDRLGVKKTELQATGLTYGSAGKVWVHIFKDRIEVNLLNAEAMKLKQYRDKIISFKVDTPTSDEKTQTVLLKVDSVSKTGQGDFLVSGHNMKKLGDFDVDKTIRSYRVDRIYMDTLKEVTLNF